MTSLGIGAFRADTPRDAPTNLSLRLQVASSDFPQWDRNLNTGGPVLAEPAFNGTLATQTIIHNRDHPSRVRVPMISRR